MRANLSMRCVMQIYGIQERYQIFYGYTDIVIPSTHTYSASVRKCPFQLGLCDWGETINLSHSIQLHKASAVNTSTHSLYFLQLQAVTYT